MHIIGLKFLAVLLNVKFPYLSATSAFIKAKSAERASSKMYFLLLNYENDNSCRSPSLWRRLDSGSRWFDYNLIRIDVGSFISCSYDNNNSITQRCFD